MPTDVFRPRLPLDPFPDAQPPWPADPDAAPAEPHTVLVLGAPTHADLAPLALSPLLASALLVIATHTPPPVPEGTLCAVVILRLPAPLDIHDAGAVRLVGLLDRAQRVAHTWHAAPHAQPRIQQLAELYPGGDFSIAEPPEFALPAASQLPAPERRPDTSETSSLSSTASSSSSLSSLAHKKSAPPKGQYTFSALINFLPATLPDKALLKHAILVTTLSAPFLAAQPPPLSYTKRQMLSEAPRRRSRFVSLFSSKHQPPSSPPSSYSNPPSLFTPSRAPSAESLLAPVLARHAHLVHVLPYSASHPHPHRSSTAPTPSSLNPNRRSIPLPQLSPLPPTKSKLAQSIEQFLLSFAYPPSASASAPSLASLSVPPPPPLPVPVPVPSSPTTPGTAPPAHRAAPARSSPLASPASSLRTSTPKRQSAYPALTLANSHSNPSVNMNMNMSAAPPAAIPYLLPAGLLGACPPGSRRCIGEMVLCGVLDLGAVGAVGVGVGVDELGVGVGGGAGGGWPRAWIGARGDVLVSGQSQGLGLGLGLGGSVPSSPVDNGFGVGSSDVKREEDVQGVEVEKAEGRERGEGMDEVHEDEDADKETQKKGKAKAKSETKRRTKTQTKTQTKIQRNEAGLPTPPESSSSSSSADGGSEDGGSEDDTDNDNDDSDVDGEESTADEGGEGTEDTHASRVSRVSNVSAPTRMSVGMGAGSSEFLGGKEGRKARSEAHFGLWGGGEGGRLGKEEGKGKGKEKGEGKEGKGKGKKLGQKVSRFFGIRFGRFVKVRGEAGRD